MIEDIESATPALCRLQLGAELRRLRHRADLKSSQVAKRLLWSPSKVTRLEYGDNVVVEPEDAVMLCELYRADPATRTLLRDYAVVTKTKEDRWASGGDDALVRPTLHAFIGLEASAVALRCYASDYVPGLLQTEAYARATHKAVPGMFSTEEIEARVATRMARKEVLHRAEAPLDLRVILSESVLLRHAGGSAVARKQLEHIAEVSTLDNVQVQVLPFSLGIHAGMSGPFTLIRFAKNSTLRPIVYLENMAASWVVGQATVIDGYERAFSDLQALAPGPQEAREMIHEAIREM
ncbi:transcriptional regulator [Embleya scabrispora]|uniref:Transcriptional regulator n=1 Tax=Embleya scabrispora TaxID=159449 RepID=A0A1T3NR34_9ACTN|nr:helix-turn-helix transcriptional regulator [Embleya scabrispora]OPC79214.1 transcriptional regulator [Embleya scabrispora]